MYSANCHERLVRFLAPSAAEMIRRDFAKVMEKCDGSAVTWGRPKTGDKLSDDIQTRGALILVHYLNQLLKYPVALVTEGIEGLFEIRIG